MLRLLGIDERRLRLKWISASEGAAFAEEIRSFVQLLKELGENPLARINRKNCHKGTKTQSKTVC
jgi:F420-non-reducing hydrogenase iron-sulfur subunit